MMVINKFDLRSEGADLRLNNNKEVSFRVFAYSFEVWNTQHAFHRPSLIFSPRQRF